MNLKKTLEKIQSNDCVIQVFGLGYVGFPLAIRLAISGFNVVGVDKDSIKIENLKTNSLIGTQLSLSKEFSESIKNGNFLPSETPIKSKNPSIGIICVPTPLPSGNTNSESYVYSSVEKFLDFSKRGDVIILESSVRVGTTEQVKKIIESKGYLVGKDFGLCVCPERIDPLNKKWKLENIPRVIYSYDDTTFQIATKIYEPINNSVLFRVYSSKIAEIVKSFENAFRLVNISLVNELAILCDKLQINVNDVIDAAATKPFGFLTFNSGAGAGGHCIPKDPTFLTESAKKMGFNFSSIENAIKINSMVPIYIVDSIKKSLDKLQLDKSVLVCGLAYKENMEDMRDSPGFKISHELVQNGFTAAAYDPHFNDELIKKYCIENRIEKLDFKILDGLDDADLKNYNCICIVQHHNTTKSRLDEIYKKSLVPLIYDCQNKIEYYHESKTVLKGLGYVSNDVKHLLTQTISKFD